MKKRLETKRTYHKNGNLRTECPFKNGIPHGWHREWHENGVLALELFLKNGVPDGVGKQWDEQGKLIVSYEIKDGTGIQEVWFPKQGIRGEISWVNGQLTGRQRTCWLDGTEVVDTYWIKGEKVSKKRYHKACKHDKGLPHYEE